MFLRAVVLIVVILGIAIYLIPGGPRSGESLNDMISANEPSSTSQPVVVYTAARARGTTEGTEATTEPAALEIASQEIPEESPDTNRSAEIVQRLIGWAKEVEKEKLLPDPHTRTFFETVVFAVEELHKVKEHAQANAETGNSHEAYFYNALVYNDLAELGSPGVALEVLLRGVCEERLSDRVQLQLDALFRRHSTWANEQAQIIQNDFGTTPVAGGPPPSPRLLSDAYKERHLVYESAYPDFMNEMLDILEEPAEEAIRDLLEGLSLAVDF